MLPLTWKSYFLALLPIVREIINEETGPFIQMILDKL
jgi:hypothetical protein